MKQSIAIAAFCFVIFIAIVTFGSVQANPQTALAPQQTQPISPTATGTITTTPTADCTVAPAAPVLNKPVDKGTVKRPVVKLKWNSVACATRYRFVVRQGSKKGPRVMHGGTGKLEKKSSSLPRGYTYFWNIKACNSSGCTPSDIWSFKIAAATSPTPQPTSPGGGTPPPPNSTVVPGNPPSQIAVYKGPGGYLNTVANELYLFDCSNQDYWLEGVREGQAVYNIDLWFAQNETISYRAFNFETGQTVESKTLQANSAGYVSYTANTSGWATPYHYHLEFKGKSSGTAHCGHFDLVSNTASASAKEHVAHTDADVERAYRAAGLEPPK